MHGNKNKWSQKRSSILGRDCRPKSYRVLGNFLLFLNKENDERSQGGHQLCQIEAIDSLGKPFLDRQTNGIINLSQIYNIGDWRLQLSLSADPFYKYNY